MIYEIRVIEYQERGMPHAHIVVKFEHPLLSNFDNKEDLAQWVDLNISCELPPDPDLCIDAEERLYSHLVRGNMVHKHVPQDKVNTCLDKDGVCRRGYDNKDLSPNTTFDTYGFPKYKRPAEKDLMVVPHEKYLLIDWNGHACVDFAMNTFCVLYLYKYLFKGSKKVRMQLKNAKDVGDKDEINLYIRGRKLNSMDAM